MRSDRDKHLSLCKIKVFLVLSLFCFAVLGRSADALEDAGEAGSVVKQQANFHIVAPGVWRSAQPDKTSLKLMKKYGLKTVINLRQSRHFRKNEKKIAEDLGLRYYQFPMNARVKPDPKTLRQILDIISNPDHQPVLVHCAKGKDRTGLIIALYKLEYMNASMEDIHREMLMYGYDQKSFPEIIAAVKNWKKNRENE